MFLYTPFRGEQEYIFPLLLIYSWFSSSVPEQEHQVSLKKEGTCTAIFAFTVQVHFDQNLAGSNTMFSPQTYALKKSES